MKRLLAFLWFKYRKAIGTALGGVTAGGLTGVVAWSGLDLNPGPGGGLDPTLATFLVGVFALAGTVLAKPNLYGRELDAAADPAVEYNPAQWESTKIVAEFGG